MNISEEKKLLKENLKVMAPRPFGEKFGEWLVSKIEKNLKPRIDPSHDAMLNSETCEIKISRALEKVSNKLTFNQKLLSENLSKFVNSTSDYKFDCNIQQVKPNYFDVIIYGTFFNDVIYLFKTDSTTIQTDKNIGYNDKQHRGNVGEGQFHIKRNNLQYHIDNFLYKKLTWDELLQIIKLND
tara:strand:+ start:66 stop:614 length:549 start_codon:yes stop_codon:yes gene_type:complete